MMTGSARAAATGSTQLSTPTDPSIIYVESQDGNVARLELKTGERRNIRPEPAAGEKPYRFDWNSPIVISPHNNRTIYYGGNRVFKSTDRGDTWTAKRRSVKESGPREIADHGRAARQGHALAARRRSDFRADRHDRRIAQSKKACCTRAPMTGISTCRATAQKPGRT